MKPLKQTNLAELGNEQLAEVSAELYALITQHAGNKPLARVLLNALLSVLEEMFLRICGGRHREQLRHLWRELQHNAEANGR